jgi:hypothetical protein
MFGLGFPQSRCLFCSAHSFCSPSFDTHIFPHSNSTLSTDLNRSLPFYLPPPGLPSSNFFNVLSPFILIKYLSHSNLRTKISVPGDLNLLQNFFHIQVSHKLPVHKPKMFKRLASSSNKTRITIEVDHEQAFT